MKFKLNENSFFNILTWILLLMGAFIIWIDNTTYGIILIAIGLSLTAVTVANKKDKK